MDESALKRGLRYSIIDGALAATMSSLAGGIFLMGFALKILKANPWEIGVLASLPMFANLIQLLGSYIIEKTGKKKGLCFFAAMASRVLWVLIILLPLKIFDAYADFRVWVLVAVIGLSSLLGSLSGIGWSAWMGELVPEDIRGSYFGKRNMISSAAGLIAVVAAGKFVSIWESRFSEENPYSFVIVFIVGVVAGLLSSWFLALVPDSEGVAADKPTIEPAGSMFLKPLKDRNFLLLVLFVSAWTFSAQLAGPFYGVFMIEHLKIGFSTITIFGLFATLATLFMMKIWGPISDKLGNKPIIMVCVVFLVFVPFIWIVALPGKYYLQVLAAHLIAGAFSAGVSLSQFNILIKLSPSQGRSTYMAIFSAMTGFIGALAPLAGGKAVTALTGMGFSVYSYSVTSLHLVFIASAILQALSLLVLVAVNEPASASPVAVLIQLRNDLNLQTGISSSTDFVMVEMERAGGLLKKLDDVTDELAEKSEEVIEDALDKFEDAIEKPLDKIKKFFKED